MKNEEAVKYEVTTEEHATMITDARIKLAGHEEPAIQISNRKELEKFCSELIGDSAVEEMHLICVNIQCKVLCEAMISTGTQSSCDAHISKIAQIALLSNAYCVFLTHNHPGGTCAPSMEDIKSTDIIQKALKMFGIRVLDHLIVTQNNGCYSFAQHGDLHTI